MLKFMGLMNSSWVLDGHDIATAFNLSSFHSVVDLGGQRSKYFSLIDYQLSKAHCCHHGITCSFSRHNVLNDSQDAPVLWPGRWRGRTHRPPSPSLTCRRSSRRLRSILLRTTTLLCSKQVSVVVASYHMVGCNLKWLLGVSCGFDGSFPQSLTLS